MKRFLALSLAVTAAMSVAAFAQQEEKKYTETEKMSPRMSEYWTPQPKVVTPGDIKTNTAP